MKKNILLGVTGGIAAYKAADIIGALRKNDFDVKVIMTEKSKEFITLLTLSTLSKYPVYEDSLEWSPNGHIEHIELSEWAQFFLIAPATANTISKLVQGKADNLLTSTYLAFDYQSCTNNFVVVCPAMNTKMYNDITSHNNIRTLSDRSNHVIVDPVEGLLACGVIGKGKLAPTRSIVEKILKIMEEC
jgi:phosphopantothenoylcysteine decarboxylase / phosphopantothenate---cysteine ligase